MRRRVHVGAVLPDHGVESGAESVLRNGVRLLRSGIGGAGEQRLAKTFPHRRRAVERVRQVDAALRRKRRVNRLQRRLGRRDSRV